jgi:hypothetical protein
MTFDEQEAIEAACIRLQQRYGTLADRQDPKFRELFAPDAVITLPGLPPFAGLAAIMQGQADWKASGVVMHHICTNFTIDVESADRASGICYLMVFRAEPSSLPAGPPFAAGVVSVGEFHDTFVRLDGRWLIERRTLNWKFRGALGGG